ncbi:MAG: HAD family hydrolase [Clostridia bacterium]|nr:HAD family hydrolase [Clostridia bacterium]
MIKAVLFDLDGTLVNSLADLAASCNFALTFFGFPTHEVEKYKYFVGDGMPKLIERVLPEASRDAETKQKVLGKFLEHYKIHFADNSYAYSGIPILLESIKKLNLKTAVISNKAQKPAEEVVSKILGGSYFDIICGKREGYPAKPDPTLTLEIIKELGIKPSECLFIGDSGMDCAVAVNSGAIGVGVLWGFREKSELLENGAKYIVETPNEILDIIKGTKNE